MVQLTSQPAACSFVLQGYLPLFFPSTAFDYWSLMLHFLIAASKTNKPLGTHPCRTQFFHPGSLSHFAQTALFLHFHTHTQHQPTARDLPARAAATPTRVCWCRQALVAHGPPRCPSPEAQGKDGSGLTAPGAEEGISDRQRQAQLRARIATSIPQGCPMEGEGTAAASAESLWGRGARPQPRGLHTGVHTTGLPSPVHWQHPPAPRPAWGPSLRPPLVTCTKAPQTRLAAQEKKEEQFALLPKIHKMRNMSSDFSLLPFSTLGSTLPIITGPEKPFLPLTIHSYLYLTYLGFLGQKWKLFCT